MITAELYNDFLNMPQRSMAEIITKSPYRLRKALLADERIYAAMFNESVSKTPTKWAGLLTTAEIMDMIAKVCENTPCAVSSRFLCDEIGISIKKIQYSLTKMVKEGVLTSTEHRAKTSSGFHGGMKKYKLYSAVKNPCLGKQKWGVVNKRIAAIKEIIEGSADGASLYELSISLGIQPSTVSAALFKMKSYGVLEASERMSGRGGSGQSACVYYLKTKGS